MRKKIRTVQVDKEDVKTSLSDYDLSHLPCEPAERGMTVVGDGCYWSTVQYEDIE